MTQHITVTRERKPTPPNTCSTCPAAWTGTSPCHCSGCHVTFSGIGLFDTHRRADRCLDPSALMAGGEPLRLVDGVWRSPEMSDEARAAFA